MWLWRSVMLSRVVYIIATAVTGKQTAEGRGRCTATTRWPHTDDRWLERNHQQSFATLAASDCGDAGACCWWVLLCSRPFSFTWSNDLIIVAHLHCLSNGGKVCVQLTLHSFCECCLCCACALYLSSVCLWYCKVDKSVIDIVIPPNWCDHCICVGMCHSHWANIWNIRQSGKLQLYGSRYWSH